MKTMIFLIALAAAGCATTPETYTDECQGFGWYPGTSGYAQCRQMMAMQERDALRQQQLILMGSANNAGYSFGRWMAR